MLVASRILKLNDIKINDLFFRVGIKFLDNDEIIDEIREEKENSIFIETLLLEADTKENLLYWLDLLEKEEKREIIFLHKH